MSVKGTAAAYALGDDEFRRSFDVAGFCRQQGTSRTTFDKWVKRVEAEGLEGLADRSRRPRSSPQRTSAEVEDLVVRLRKELHDDGHDHGATTIQWHLGHELEGSLVPSVATIHRILVRRGLVAPEPEKRPKNTFRRFEAPAPNEWWQIDHTDWVIGTGTVKIFNIIDDHSRVLIRSRASIEATGDQAWIGFGEGSRTWGLPAGILSDNGLCFSGKVRHMEVFFEAQLRDAGVRPFTGRPYHPQTTGKVERFQQTLKKWLRRQRLAATIEELQAQLDRFAEYYNHRRPHQGIGRVTPISRWRASPVSGPAEHPLPPPDWSSRQRSVPVDMGGCVEVDHYRIYLGRKHTGRQAVVVHDHVRANVFIDGELVRHLELDTTRRYQPKS